jgi:hypothetical protein
MGGTRRSRQDDAALPSKKPRTQTVTMDSDNASNASSLTGNTKYSIQTKMSTIENTITDMQSGMKNMQNMMVNNSSHSRNHYRSTNSGGVDQHSHALR